MLRREFVAGHTIPTRDDRVETRWTKAEMCDLGGIGGGVIRIDGKKK